MANRNSDAELVQVPVGAIAPNPRQPRTEFDQDSLRELAGSIREHGLIQPLVVTRNGGEGTFVLIAGERRWRATQLAGLETVPVVVKDGVDEQERALLALDENLHRADLNVIEEARAYRQLMDEFGLGADEVARRCGKNVTAIYSRLKWLRLEPEIQSMAARGTLPRDVRVADALLSVPDGTLRVKLAHRLAYDGVRIKTIQTACAHLVEKLDARAMADPALTRAMKQVKNPPRKADRARSAAWDTVRQAAAGACQACDIKTGVLRDKVREPAWEMLAHTSKDTCEACNVRDVMGACDGCPLVEFLRRVISSANELDTDKRI